MDYLAEAMKFAEEEAKKDSSLTALDLAYLKLGFVAGCKAQLEELKREGSYGK